MYFSNEDIKYLSGEKFSSGYRLRLQDNKPVSRLECLINMTKGERVLHIGFCDHIPLIMHKIETKTWLHGLLRENCPFLVGIDNNKEAIEYIRNLSLPPPPPPPQKKPSK